jgi:hypothetical protein
MRQQSRRWPQKGRKQACCFNPVPGGMSALDFRATRRLPPPSYSEWGELMADRKEPKEIRAKAKPAAKHFSESSPNPHGESKILQMPIKTHQRNETGGKNIPQVPNTVGGNLNPSVAHEFQGRVVTGKPAPDKRARTSRPVTEIKRKDA